MSNFSSIIAGFGGQGSLLMGKIMAYAGMLEGKQVSWCPSYGPEMRGGTANVNVIISDETVGSPVVTKDADCIVALNQPSLDKFAPVVKVGGNLVINSDLCTAGEVKEGVKVYNIPANTIAVDNFGGAKLTNLVMLGAVVYATGAVDVNGMDDTFAHVFEGGKAKFIRFISTLVLLGGLCWSWITGKEVLFADKGVNYDGVLDQLNGLLVVLVDDDAAVVLHLAGLLILAGLEHVSVAEAAVDADVGCADLLVDVLHGFKISFSLITCGSVRARVDDMW